MSDKPENDPTAIQRRRTFLKRMAAAGFVAGAVVTFEPMVANAVTPGEHQDGILDDFFWHRHKHTTTTAAPTTSMAPTTTIALSTTMALTTTMAPTTSMAPTTTMAPTTSMAPTTTAAPHHHHHRHFFL